jgi:hypothetical protein
MHREEALVLANRATTPIFWTQLDALLGWTQLDTVLGAGRYCGVDL